ncbi:MAG: MBOAT family protein [Clostridia bacterium]|nr:MBOAT family protein [Clostridia bacterium]
MTIVSLPFFLFTAAVVLVYYAVPKKIRWTVLLAGSSIFYALNSGWLALVLAGTSLLTFVMGWAVQKVLDASRADLKAAEGLSREEKKKRKEAARKKARALMLTGVLADLAALLFLKYFNFFGSNLNRLLSALGTGGRIPALNLLLPLGISFYTLQAMAYLIDVYRGKTAADRNPAKFMLFMSFFPQIVQGPIPRHSQLAHQLYEGHDFDYQRLCFGAQLMLWGIFKKIVIAERLSGPVQALFAADSAVTGPAVFLGACLYGLQVYTDFSGGMDIVRGVAQMLGIELELNFTQPYFASSVEDFWRRWHITMGAWMRDYIFYPLSLSKAFTNLSRKSRKVFGAFVGKRLPAFLAMFIVYFLVGLWHGADWKYIVYGVWNGVFITSGILLENAYAKARGLCGIDEGTVTWRAFRILRTFAIVSFGRYFSRADSLGHAMDLFRRTFIHWRDLSFLTDGTLLKWGLNTANWVLLAVCVLILFYVDARHEKGISFRRTIAAQALPFRWLIYIGAVLALLIFGCYGPEYSAASFIYERF